MSIWFGHLFVFGPPLVVLLLLVGVLLVLGAVLLGGTARRGAQEPGVGNVCSGCGHANPDSARFCARCGRALGDSEPD